MTNQRLLNEIRAKNPNLASGSDDGSRKAAIRLFCLECVGGSKAEVRRCVDTECPLFQYRTGPYVKGGVSNVDTRGSSEDEDTEELDDDEPPLGDDDEPPL